MFNINNKNLISVSAGLLFVFATVIFLTPNSTYARSCPNLNNNVGAYYCYTGDDDYNNYNNNVNPIPSIYSINPTSNTVNTSTTITVTGNNFVQGSTVRLNNSAKPTTFINSKTLQAQLSYYDLSSKGEYFITVFNPAPGGGYSNVTSFIVNSYIAPVTNNNTVRNTTTSKTKNVTTNTTTNKNSTENNSTDTNSNTNQNVKDLAAGAIFGSNAFMPSSLLQWIFFAILILLAVILWRKLYVSDEDKHTPLKHA